jgi:hypothetical protein
LFMECEGEECTVLLLRRFKAAFPDLMAPITTVGDAITELREEGILDDMNASGLLLATAWKDRIEQAILAQDKKGIEDAVILLIVLHEHVASDASMPEDRRRAFLEAYQTLFPTQFSVSELQTLDKEYDVHYAGPLLPLSRDAIPKKTFVSKKALTALTQQINAQGLEVLTLTFAS